jgi:hypothetical protein
MEKSKLRGAASAAGRSLLEMLWEELDDIMDRLVADGKPNNLEADEWLAYGEERGRAQGITYAIAVIMNPYKVDVPKVKRIAAKRLEARQDG